MKFRLALTVAALAGAACGPAQAALETLVEYDAFASSTGDLDPNLWGFPPGPIEQKKYINDLGQLEVGMRVRARGDTNVGSTAATYGVNFIDPAKVREIAATITMQGAGSADCAANTDTGFTSASIAGSFFSNGTKTANSQVNDIIAQLRFERGSNATSADGTTQIVARVDQCTNADCTVSTQLFRQQLGAPVPIDVPVRVYLRWDQAAKKFNFKRGTDPYVVYTYTMADTVAPSMPFKGLHIRDKIKNCATVGADRSGWASAIFDAVSVNTSADRVPSLP